MTILFLIKLIIILSGILITIILFFCKDISRVISRQRKYFKELIIRNSGFFTIFFILVFLFEQIIFIFVLAYFFKVSKWLSAIVGIFALIVVTTAAFQKFVWEYKFQWSEDIRKSGEIARFHIQEQEDFIDSLLVKLKVKTNKLKKK